MQLLMSKFRQTKTTTTILLKPFLNEDDLARLENDSVFRVYSNALRSQNMYLCA